MSDVTLTSALKAALLATQQNAALADQTRERLATGRRVNRANDDPPAFFAAQALSGRAGELLAVKDTIDLGASAIGATVAGLDAIAGLTGQLKGIALAARGGSAETRAAAAAQFDAVRNQITAIAADTTFGGVSLISASPGDLAIPLNETGSATLTIQGVASDAASLGIGAAAGDFNGFATDADITAAVQGLDTAVATARTTAAGFGSQATLLNTRLDFTSNLINSLDEGAGKLVDADLNEEAANLLALNLSREFGTLGIGIANDNNDAVLRLLDA